jgi:hypothetical protein
LKLGEDALVARAELQRLNQMGDLEECLLEKKKYLLTVVKAYERMAKKRGRPGKGQVRTNGWVM